MCSSASVFHALIQLLLLADEVRHEADVSLTVLLEGEAGVLRVGLTFLQRLSQILCSLVGLAIVVTWGCCCWQPWWQCRWLGWPSTIIPLIWW